MDLVPDSMEGLGEVHISSARVLQWQLPQNADRHYCGAKEPPWTANLCVCCGPLASYVLMLSYHKEQITAYYSTAVQF
jgi:hypothetical protein